MRCYFLNAILFLDVMLFFRCDIILNAITCLNSMLFLDAMDTVGAMLFLRCDVYCRVRCSLPIG